MSKKISFIFILIFCFVSYSFSQINKNNQYKNAKQTWIDKETSNLKFIRFQNPENVNEQNHSDWLRNLLSLPNQVSFKLKNKSKDQLGQTHYRYNQFINNYKVDGAQYLIHKEGNNIVSANGEYHNTSNITSQINIDKTRANNLAKAHVLATQYAEEKNLDEIELVYVNIGNTLRLTYKIDVYALKPLARYFVFVDVANGSILKKENRIHSASVDGVAHTKYHGVQSIKTDSLSSYQYTLVDSTRMIFTLDMNEGTNYSAAQYFQDSDNIWDNTNNNDDAALDAHWGIENSYDYFLNTFGLNAYDGSGSNMLNYIHFDTNYVNAFWNGSNLSFGDGDGVTYSPLTDLDIVAHEYTHAVTTSSANLVYENEPGALNESFSDIFGVTIDFLYNPSQANWLLGEVSNLTGSFFRSMENPNIKNDPDTYLGNYWYIDTLDYGGVHTNSGVQNYWFYLLTNGGSGTNDNNDFYNVDGIGLTDAASIAYRNLSVYLTTNSEYADARFYAIQSAIDLFGTCSQQEISTTNAWYAVGVGTISDNAGFSAFSSEDVSICSISSSVSFNNNSINDTASLWLFGDGNSDTTRNPVHTYSAVGVYDVTLISYGSNACGNFSDTLVFEDYVSVSNDGPIPATCTYQTTSGHTAYGITNFTFNDINHSTGGAEEGYGDFTCSQQTTVTEGDIVNLSVTVISGSDYYKVYIDFNNDGAFDESTEVIYTISNVQGTTSTNYVIPDVAINNVALRMRVKAHSSSFSSSCTGHVQRTQVEDYSIVILDLNTPPVTNFFANDTIVGVGTPVGYTNIPNAFQTGFLWSFPGGVPSSSTFENPVVEYYSSGEYDAQLITTNSFGSDTLLKTNYVEVLNEYTMCNNVVSSSLDSGIIYDSGGLLGNYSSYEDCYFLINPSCADAITLNFSYFITEGGYDKLYVYDGTSTSAPLLGTFHGSSLPQSVVATSGAMYLYFHSDGSSNRFGYVLDWETTKVFPSPTVADFSMTNLNPPISSLVEFTDLSTGLPISWLWNFSNGDTSILQNPNHVFSTPGVYNVELIASSCFQSDTIVKILTVQDYPNLAFFPTEIEETINACSDSVIVPITIYNTGLGDLEIFDFGFSVPADSLASFINFSSTGENTIHTFNIDKRVDTLHVAINMDGDFSASNEFATLYIDGVNLGEIPDNFSDQVSYEFDLFGAQLASFLVDNQLDILIDNNNYVSAYTSNSNFHQIIIEYADQTEFISYELDANSLPNNDSTTLSISLSTVGLMNGTYLDTLSIYSNDSVVSLIPITLINTGSAGIVFGDTCVDFNNTRMGETDSSGVWIYNTGCDTLEIYTVSSSENEISSLSQNFNIAPFDSSFLVLVFEPDTIEPLVGTLSVISNLGFSSVCLSGEGLAIPIIDYTQTQIVDTFLSCDDSITIPFTIYNSGFADLDFNLSVDQIIPSYNANFFEGFESNNFNQWIGYYANTQYSITNTTASSGTYSLQSLSNFKNVYHNLDNTKPNYLSFKLKSERVAGTNNFISFGGNSMANGFEYDNFCQVYFYAHPDETRKYHVDDATYEYVVQYEWTHFEIKHINYINKTYDLYIDNTFIQSVNFTSDLQDITTITFGNSTSNALRGTAFYDDIIVSNEFPGWLAVDTSAIYTNIEDSITIDVTLSTSDLVSGNYDSYIFISSNDPVALVDTIPVSLTIIGEPEMVLDYSCVLFDTILEQSVTSSLLMLENLGCSFLSIDSLYITNPLFSLDTLSLGVNPNDSALININFAPLNSGVFNGLLEIYSNDFDTTICLEAFVPISPILHTNSDSIIETIVGCSDSIIVPITVYNPGGSVLDVSLDTYGDFNTELFIFEDFEINNATPDNIIPGNNCLELVGSDELIFSTPQNQSDYFSVKLRSEGTSTSGTNYVTVGVAPNNANVVFFSWNGYSNSYGIYTGYSNYYTHYVPNNQEWTFFELKNINFVTHTYDVYVNEVEVMHQAPFRNDYYDYMSSVKLYGTNSISYYDDLYIGRDFPNWASMETDSSQVSSNDSSIVNLILYSNNLHTGTYFSNVVIESNDPYNTSDTIPISFTVTGDPELSFESNCLDFETTQQFNTTNAGIWLYNTGCDSLIINQISLSNTDISFVDTNFMIYANDSFYFEASFNPYTIGQYNETITFSSNVGNIDLCVTGEAYTSTNYSPTIIIDTILSCNDSIQIPLELYNTNNFPVNVQLNTHGELTDGKFFFFDGFEDGNYNNWNSIGDVANINIVSNGAATGNNCLELDGPNSSYTDGLLYEFPIEPIDYISVKLKTTANSYHERNHVHIGNTTNMNALTEINAYNQTYYISSRYSTYTYTPTNIEDWTFFEIKNIDYITHTFDVFINGTIFQSGLEFYDPNLTGITRVRLGNNYATVPSYFDDIQIGRKATTDNLTTDAFDINIPANDTINSNIILYSYGLPIGTHLGSISLTSSDSTEPLSIIPVSLTVIGEAILELNGNSCLNFDTTFQYLTDTLGLWLYNTGCDSLIVNNITSTVSDIYFETTSIAIAPYDSFLLNSYFTPTSYQNFNVNATIFTNVGTKTICFNGYTLGVSEISYSPLEIIDTIFSCTDSLVIPINIYNTGNDSLKLNFQLGYKNDFDYLFFEGFEFDSLSNLNNMSPASSFHISAENAASGKYCLNVTSESYVSPTANITIPNGTVNYISFKTKSNFSLTSYPRYDIEIYGVFHFERYTLNNFYLQNGLYYNIDSLYDWLHFELKNIDYVNRTYDLYINQVLIQSGKSFNYSYSTNFSNLSIELQSGVSQLFDDFQFGYETEQNWTFENSFIDNNIGVNDSGVFNLVIRSGSYPNDTYLDTIFVSSNDPLSLFDTIPISITLIGKAEINFNDSCVVLDTVMQHREVNYKLAINNPGCDTLYIDSIYSINEFITFDTLLLTIPPFSSDTLTVFSNPILVGDYSGDIHFETSIGDTSICLSGTTTGAPIISHSPLQIVETINSCNDSIIIPITVYNDGLGELNTDLHLLNFTQGDEFSYFNGFEEIDNLAGWEIPNSPLYNYTDVIGYVPGFFSILPASGDSCLRLTKWEDITLDFPTSQVEYIAVDLKTSFSGSLATYFIIPGIGKIYRESSRYVIKTTNTVETYAILPYNTSPWVNFEFRNINYQTKTFDLYVDNSLEYASMPFKNQATNSVSQIELVNTYDNFYVTPGSYYDNITIGYPQQNWIQSSVDTTTTAINDSTTFNVVLSSADLANDVYHSNIVLTSNDPLSPFDTIPVTFTVNGSAELVLSTECLHFDTLVKNNPTGKSLFIYNTGCDDLIVTNIVSSHNEISIPYTLDTILPDGSMAVSVVLDPDSIQNYSGYITIYTNIGDTTICFDATVKGNPIISVNPTEIVDTVPSCAGTQSYPITILNTGNEVLEYTIYDNLVFNDFETSVNNGSWYSNSNLIDNTCQPGRSVGHFSGSEYINTGYISAYQGVKLEFDLKMTNSIDGCSSQFASDDKVYLSSTYGAYPNYTIAIIDSFLATDFSVFKHVSVDIPNSSQNSNIKYTLYNKSSSLSDHWFVDNLSLFHHETQNVSSVTGSVLEGSSIITQLTYGSSTLVNGTYSSDLYICSNDLTSEFIQIPIDIVVSSEPVLTTNDQCILLEEISKNFTTTVNDSIHIKNDGCENLIIYDIVSSNNAIVISETSFTLSQGSSNEIDFSIQPTVVGDFTDIITIYSNADTISICVKYEVEEVGTMLIDPITVNSPFKLCEGNVQEQFYVYNTGAGVLTWSLLPVSDITLSPSSATMAPGDSVLITMDITMNATGNNYKQLSFFTNNPSQPTYIRTFNYQISTDPCANFTYTSNSSCIGVFTFQDNSQGTVLSRTWNFGDGSSSSSVNPSYSYANTGNYTVEYITCGYNYCDTTTQNISVNNTSTMLAASCYPLANASSIAGITNVSLNTLNNSSSINTINDYEDFSCTEGTQLLQNVAYDLSVTTSVSSAQNVKVWIDYNNNGILETSERIMNRNASLTHLMSITVPNTAVLNTNLRMRVMSSYQNNSVSSACDNTTSGQIEDYYVHILYNALPPVAGFYSVIDNNCSGEVTFIDTSSHNPTSWHWDFGDGNTSTYENPLHQYTTEGTYTVTLVVTNMGGSSTFTKEVNVEFFEIDFTIAGSNIVNSVVSFSPINTYSESVEWFWNFGDGNSSILQNATNQFATVGTYTIQLNAENANGCIDYLVKTFEVLEKGTVDTAIAIIEIGNDFMANLHPNPNNGSFTFEYKGKSKNLNLSIYNPIGKVVYDNNFKVNNELKVFIENNELAKGLYLLEIRDDNFKKIIKFIVK